MEEKTTDAINYNDKLNSKMTPAQTSTTRQPDNEDTNEASAASTEDRSLPAVHNEPNAAVAAQTEDRSLPAAEKKDVTKSRLVSERCEVCGERCEWIEERCE